MMRLQAARVVAVVSALGWLVLPGFGLIDLAVTWSPEWPQVLEAGWGLFFSVIVAGPFVLVALRPDRLRAAAAQLGVAVGALAVAAIVTGEPRLIGLAGLIVAEAGVVGFLARGRRRVAVDERATTSTGWSRPLLAITLLGGVPWLAYTWQMLELDRRDAPVDLTLGIDHYAVQGAVGLAMVGLGVLAVGWPVGRRLLSVTVGITAAYFGIVSFGWPGSAGGVDPRWSVAAILWGATVIVAGWLWPPRASPSDRAAERATFPAGR